MRSEVFIILAIVASGFLSVARAQDLTPMPSPTEVKTETCLVDADSVGPEKKGNIISRIINYFSESNTVRRDKAFDFSILGGPYYSSDTKFGVGLVAAGLYSTNRADTLTPLSDITLYGNVSTIGYYQVGIRGHNLFYRDRYRINYEAYFSSMPSKFWGIGYDNDVNDDNETRYKRLQSEAFVDFLFQPVENFFVGPAMNFRYAKGTVTHGGDDHLWQGEEMRVFNYGIGIVLSYDTRDHMTNPYKGVYLGLEQRFYPRFLGNKYRFSSTQFTASWYKQVWKGGVIASQLHTMLTYGNTPWSMLATFGGSKTMRGYYDGRYCDKNEIDITVELRQRVWRRSGVVAWVGAGTVFPNFSKLQFRHVLPNFGIGYRWEFKNRVNVRLDLGFGKNQMGFVFNINEAF